MTDKAKKPASAKPRRALAPKVITTLHLELDLSALATCVDKRNGSYGLTTEIGKQLRYLAGRFEAQGVPMAGFDYRLTAGEKSDVVVGKFSIEEVS